MADEEWLEQHHQHQKLELYQQQQRRTQPPKHEPYFAVSIDSYQCCGDWYNMIIYLNPPNEDGACSNRFRQVTTTTYFRLCELQLIETYLERTDLAFLSLLSLDKCNGLEFEMWRTLLRIIKRGIPNLDQLEVILNPVGTAADASGLDQKLALLPNEFLNLTYINVSDRDGDGPAFAVRLPTFYESIRQPKSLQYISLNSSDHYNFFLSPNCLYKIADSIENLPNLEHFDIDDFIIQNDDPDSVEAGWEAVFCAAGSHPKFQTSIDATHLKFMALPTWGQQYTGDPTNLDQLMVDQLDHDYRTPVYQQHNINTLRNGPSVDQVLTQLKRQRRLPEGFPQNNLYDGNDLELWVQALIVVKDIQLKGKDRWDVFHFLFSQLVDVLNYNYCSQEYWDNSNPDVRVPWLLEPEAEEEEEI